MISWSMEILYGRNPVLESLRAGRRKPVELILADGVRSKDLIQEIVALARQMHLVISRLPKEKLGQLVGHRQHQGIALKTSEYPFSNIDAIFLAAKETKEPPFLLFLDLIQDPQNAGALLRTAEAVGVHGVILQERRAVGITPAVVNSSSGATEHLNVAMVTNLARTMREVKDRDVWLYGLDGRPQATELFSQVFSGPIALVVGSEGSGLRRLVRETCDELVRIPMRGRIESLNASIAGSVALYAVMKDRASNIS